MTSATVAAAKQRVAAQGRGALIGGQARQAAMSGRTGGDVPVLPSSQAAAPSHAAVAGVSGGGIASPGLSGRASPGIPAAMLGKSLGRGVLTSAASAPKPSKPQAAHVAWRLLDWKVFAIW
eukprot:SM000282S10612  [mRNA]  locus=s282:69376:70154:- [translate_table: standard]